MKVTLPAPENGERVVFLRTGVHGLDAFTEMRRAPNQDLTMITILPQERTGTVVSKSLRFGDTTVVGVGTAEEVMESEALGHPRQLIERILALCGQAWK
ncbi:hypothetical protein [Longimicrobium terrae]|nr:hypothetical protein [Longimicrobium terrae]NNC31651.1 hypothetical protein [Longimicrobium terrae]